MSTPSPIPRPTPRRKSRRFRWIPLILLGLILVFGVWFVVRGTWADPEKRFPKSVSDGPLTHLCLSPTSSGVHSAILIEAPIAKVWEVIQDYESHPRFLPFLSEIKIESRTEDRVDVTGIAHSQIWGNWPFTIRIQHRTEGGREFSALWDNPSEYLKTNRGGWTISTHGEKETLVSLFLEIDTGRSPRFFVNNLLLNRLSNVMLALKEEVNRRATQQ
jgi:coenzyme Q-binding protein COQ10